MRTKFKYTKNFRKDEFKVSNDYPEIAKTMKISEKIDSRLQFLCNSLMQPIRNTYKITIYILSGYRHESLNSLVGGAYESDHKKGIACDFTIDDKDALYDVFCQIAKNFQYRQIIFYPFKDKSKRFIHISVNIPGPRYKHQALVYNGKENGKHVYLPLKDYELEYIDG